MVGYWKNSRVKTSLKIGPVLLLNLANRPPPGVQTATKSHPWLMEFGQYGCCPSQAGFLPYLLGTQYCCKIEGAAPGKDYKISTTQCKCHRYGC